MADETVPPTTTTTAKPPLSDADKQKRREFWNNTIQKGAYGLRRSGSGLGGKAAMMGMPMYTNKGGAAGPGQYVDYGRDYDQAKMLAEYQQKERDKYFPKPTTGGPGPAVTPTAQPAPAIPTPQAAGASLADTLIPQQASSPVLQQGKSTVRTFF